MIDIKKIEEMPVAEFFRLPKREQKNRTRLITQQAAIEYQRDGIAGLRPTLDGPALTIGAVVRTELAIAITTREALLKIKKITK